MANRMQEELTRLLDSYDKRRRADTAREQKAKDEEALFLTQFDELRREVIRPVFEAAGELLEARGHRYSISEQAFAAGAAGKISEAGISLRVVAAGTKAALHEDQQALTITTRHYNKTVWINSGESSGSGGLAGAKGAFPLQKVTRQMVEDEVIAFVGRVVAG